MMERRYSREGTARVFWNKMNSAQYNLQINPFEPPEREPEINAYFACMSSFGIPRELVGIHAFDLASDKDCKVLDTIIKALEEEYKYFACVRQTPEGEYDGFYISAEKPDDYAAFNLETLEWDLPENLETLKQLDYLRERENTLRSSLSANDQKMIRPLSALIGNWLEGTEPDPEEREFFERYMAEKLEMRDSLTSLLAELAELEEAEKKVRA